MNDMPASTDPRTLEHFRFEPDPDDPDWWVWEVLDPKRFNHFMGRFRARRESETIARVRMIPKPEHSNLGDVVHGGVLMSFADGALFCASTMLGVERAGPSVTLDLNMHFIAPGELDKPLDAVVEVLRQTRRMVFLRGLIVQGDATVAEFSSTIRKPSSPK